MIRDLIIIKDGVPLLAKNLSNSQKSIFSKQDDLILVSGFFSALNSFSDHFQNLGSISELKLSNSNVKLSFLNDSNIRNMVYMATYDENSNSVDVKRFLKSVSHGFVKRFGIDQIIKWNGRRELFEAFEDVVDNFLEDNDKRIETYSNNKANQLFKSEIEIKDNIPDYYNYVPYFKISTKINPEHYLTGEFSYKVFNQINGIKSIYQIADALKIDEERVYAICKNLIKFGFISLS